MRLLAWIWILPFLFQLATAHAARRWFGSDVIPLKVHDLDSRTTRLRFDYTYLKLCPAPISLTSLRKQLDFEIKVLKVKECDWLCKVPLDEEELQRYRWMIDNNYEIFYSINHDVPALYENKRKGKDGKDEVYYDLGFPVGWKTAAGEYVVNNQINLEFWFRRDKDPAKGIEIVNLVVRQATCSPKFYLWDNSTFTAFYYSVNWRQVDKPLEIEQDISDKERLKWLIFGALVNIVFCVAIAGLVFWNVKRDLAHYCHTQTTSMQDLSQSPEPPKPQPLTWLQHRSQVFRPPPNPLLLSILLGSGIQIIFVVFSLLLVFAIKGYHYFQLEDAKLALLLKQLLACSSFFGGFASVKVYRMWGGDKWMSNAVMAALFLPLTIEVLMVVDNVMRMAEGALATKFWEMLYLFVLWELSAVAMGLLGGYIAEKTRPLPTLFNPSTVLTKKQYSFGLLKQLSLGLLTSLLPYMTFAAQYHIFLDSFWQSNFYGRYLYQFLSILFLLTSTTLSSLYTTYKSLSNGNPRWWSIPWLVAFGVAVCTFLAQVAYLVLEIRIRRVASLVIYLTWSVMAGGAVFLGCGAAGVMGTAIGVKRMYSMAKMD